MLLHILQKDLKRKRTMNIILLIFITLATTFLAASTKNMLTITGAVDYFMEISNIPDFLSIMISEDGETPLEEFLSDNRYVSEYEVSDTYVLTDETIEISYCAADSGSRHYEKGNTLMLEALPEHFLKVFDEEDAPVVLKSGEIAVPRQQAEKNRLRTGDKVNITCGDKSREFTIGVIVKDAAFGTEMIGPKRLFISREDYESLTEGDRYHMLIYCINCTDAEAFEQEFRSHKDFITNIGVDKNTLKMCYFFNIVIAGIMVIVGICLILVSFLILRFTIVFTIQEDYKEIGIMKAIGIRERRIKSIYLLKYLAIAVTAAAIGFGLSIPFEEMLLFNTMDNLVIPPKGSTIWVNLLCATFIVLLVVGFCYACTGKIRKLTAIEAVRNGGNGERYGERTKFALHKRGRMRTYFYMACNDVAGNLKRYLVLAVIFCIGTMEILLPLMAIHTLKDGEILGLFSVQPSSLFIDNRKTENYLVEEDVTLLRSDMERLENELAEHGFSAHVWGELWYMLSCYGDNPDVRTSSSTYVMQQLGKDEDNYTVLEGSVPLLANEIMVTEKTAEEIGVSIGDTVYVQFEEEETEYIVTGIYQSMMNMGNGLRVSRQAKLPYQALSGMLAFQAEVGGDLQGAALKEAVEEIFPDYEIQTAEEWVKSMVGVIEQLDSMKIFITLLVLIINVLITVLMVKTLITRERGEIAMLKSIGFSDRTIRSWQSMRILIVLSAAILMGTVLSGILGPVTVGKIFSVMGATSIRLVTNPFEAYLLYPLLLLSVTGAAAYLCAAEIKRVDLKEINTLE